MSCGNKEVPLWHVKELRLFLNKGKWWAWLQAGYSGVYHFVVVVLSAAWLWGQLEDSRTLPEVKFPRSKASTHGRFTSSNQRIPPLLREIIVPTMPKWNGFLSEQGHVKSFMVVLLQKSGLSFRVLVLSRVSFACRVLKETAMLWR